MANSSDTVAKVRDALGKLDPSNNDHWTDEGFPKVSVVQRIANDTTITRQSIQLAAPRFERPVIDPATGIPVSKPETAAAQGATAVNGAAAASTGPEEFPDLTQGDGELMTEDEVRAELDRRVVAAGQAITDAQNKIKEGNGELVAARKLLEKTSRDRNAAFPPMTAAENIKAHIAAENAIRAARVAGHAGPSQLDLAMRRSNSRGWRRPTRSLAPTITGAATGGNQGA